MASGPELLMERLFSLWSYVIAVVIWTKFWTSDGMKLKYLHLSWGKVFCIANFIRQGCIVLCLNVLSLYIHFCIMTVIINDNLLVFLQTSSGEYHLNPANLSTTGRIESVSWCMVTFSDMCVIFSKPRHFKPVSTIFLFFHWMIALQKLWKCFLFYLKNSFRFWGVYIFVFFYLAFHFFQVQKDKWMWNNLCVMNWLEYIKRCKFLE